MPKKTKAVFVCQECGYETPKWMGQCICGAWNSFVEEKVVDLKAADPRRRGALGGPGSDTGSGKRSQVVKASLLKSVGTGEYTRLSTGIGELDRVLGGGLVRGSLVLISGEPGIGKSTLIIQAAGNIAAAGKRVLYVTGEESEEQVKMRADRVLAQISDNLFILAETNMESVLAVC